jgi:hypothetical protein
VSTRPVAPDQLSDGWERINPIAIRMDAPGGWIYDIVNSGPVFVPHPVNGGHEADQSCVESALTDDERLD